MKTQRRKYASFAAVTVLLGLAAALVIAELLLRVLQTGYGNNPWDSDPVLHHVHPPSYTYRMHVPSEEYGGFLVRYDENGLTCDPYGPAVDAGRARYRVAFLGDSFVEANQVPYKKSFVGRLQKNAGSNAALRNYGVSSYSPIFYLVQWRTQMAAFRPTHVFLFLFNNDVYTDADMIKEARRNESGEIIAIPGSGGRFKQLLRKLYVFRLVRRAQLKIRWHLLYIPEAEGELENPNVTALTSGLVLTLAGEAEESGVRLVLLAVPSKYRLEHPEAEFNQPENSHKWRDWAGNHGLEFIDLVPMFESAQRSGTTLFFEKDGHFNEAGHAVVAEALRREFPEVFGTNVIVDPAADDDI